MIRGVIASSILFSIFSFVRLSALTDAEARQMAEAIYLRFGGAGATSSAESTLSAMTTKILDGAIEEAALIAMDDEANGFIAEFIPAFVTESFIPTPFERLDVRQPFTHSVSTAVGIIRDNRDFREFLMGDIIYVPNEELSTWEWITEDCPDGYSINYNGNPFQFFYSFDWGCGSSAPYTPIGKLKPQILVGSSGGYIGLSNSFQGYWRERRDYLSTHTFSWYQDGFLIPLSQTEYYSYTYTQKYSASDVSGLFSTYEVGKQSFYMGTNRRGIKDIAQNFLGRQLDELFSLDNPHSYIRPDVERAPLGEPEIFENTCSGCHAAMDPLANAFVHNRFGGRENTVFLYDTDIIPSKINRIDYGEGDPVTDNTWVNYWASNPDIAPLLGFRETTDDNGNPLSLTNGQGPNHLMRVFSNTEAFTNNIGKLLFRHICGREPQPEKITKLHQIARAVEQPDSSFNPYNAQSSYNFRRYAALVTAECFIE